MKMKMKMKNNKMFLALVVVAALAMVSVAGVAVLSDDSSAASNTLDVNGNTTIPTGFTSNVFIYGVSTTTNIVIPDDVTYSGTISVGSRTGDGTTGSPYVYVTNGSITLTGVTNVTISASDLLGTLTVAEASGAANVTANISVTDGSLFVSGNGYTGTITTSDATFTLKNVKGLMVSYNTGTSFSGAVSIGADVIPSSWTYALNGPKGSITIEGTASIVGTFSIADAAYIDLIISGDVTMPASSICGTYTVATGSYVYSVTVDGTPLAAATTAVTDASALSVGTYYFADLTGTTLYYKVTATVGVHKIVMESGIDSTRAAALAAGRIMTMTSLATVVDDGTATVSFAPFSAVVVPTVSTFNMTAASVATLSAATGITISGTPTLTGVTNAGTAPTLGAVAISGTSLKMTTTLADDTWSGYLNVVLVANAVSCTYTFFIDVTATGTGTSTVEVTAVSAAVGTISTAVTLGTDSTTTVDGNLNINYSAVDVLPTLSNSGTIKVTGNISYQTVSTEPVFNTSTGTINATGYSVAVTTTTPLTYNYTTLDKALAASANVKIYGALAILTDKTLVSTLAGATTTKIAVNLGATVTIGSITAFTNVTVPNTTTLTINGSIVVVYGKLIFENKSAAPACNAGITASVGMKEGTSYTYTDLATALAASVSGDTVALRGDASISTDATIIDGVTVTSDDWDIIVTAGGKLTVTGTLTMTGAGYVGINGATTGTAAKAAGQLVINKMPSIASTSEIVLNGVMTISASVGTSTIPAALPCAITTAGTLAAPGVLNIAGIVSTPYDIGTNLCYMTVNVTGTLKTTSSLASSTARTTMNVTGEFDYSSATTHIFNLNVTGSGIVKNAVTGTGILFVDGKAIVGTASKTSTVTTDDVTVELTLSSGASAIVYGTPALGKVVIKPTATVCMATMYVNSATVYGTAYTPLAGSVTVAVPEITGTTFMGWYDNPSFIGTTVLVNSVTTAAQTVGQSYYMKLTGVTYSVTFTAVQNGTWAINGNVVSGTSIVAYASSYTVTFIANNGYELKDVSILLNGKAMPSNYTPTTGDVLSISGSVEEKSVGNSGLSVTEILLIVMVIIIALIAVVVILKLMRS